MLLPKDMISDVASIITEYLKISQSLAYKAIKSLFPKSGDCSYPRIASN